MNFQFAAQGRSFKGAMAYYTHDKRGPEAGQHPTSAERVAWTETRNLATDRPEVATRVMIATAERADELKAEAGIKATGRKAQNPVMAYSLAWHPNEAGKLDRGEMARAANDSLRVLGLEKHQAVIVAHRDTAHPHVHVIVNRVSPEDGRMAKIDPNRVRALDRWAYDYEKQRGQIVSPERAAKFERQAEQRRKHPDPEQRRAHTDRSRAERAQEARGRQQAASGASTLGDAQKAVQRAAERPPSPATILRDIGAATKERHRAEWAALRGSYAAGKAAIYERHRDRIGGEIAAHKRETKPEWAAQFRRERAEARERQQMERGFAGRLSLSIVAAREQHRSEGGSFAKLIAVNFLSRERREGAFAAASQRDRAALSERLGVALSERLKPLTADRGRALSEALDRFKADRGALSERQAGEWQKIREAWRQVGRDRGPDRAQDQGRGVALDKGRQAEAPRDSRFAWLDQRASIPGRVNIPEKVRGAEQHQQAEQVQEVRQPSKFDWLDRQKDPEARERDRQERSQRGRDRDDRER